MTWARFDDNYDSHPKILAAGRDAKNLHEASIRWSCRVRSAGRIPRAALAEIAALAQLPASRAVRERAAARCLEMNLWEDQGDHWAVHDFDEYSQPRATLSRGQRVAVATKQPSFSHDPSPVSRPVVSLENLRERALGRGLAAETLQDRLADLQRRVEGRGKKAWIPYVLAEKFGSCLFDQEVGRWLEEDHAARKERETPPPFTLPSKAMPA